ncbi:MAG: chorismate mutase [Clostridiales bacterium]|nr:chorismate mutase [Clostridiales bacterium]
MTLDEIRAQIEEIDAQMKPLFLKRMECARHVAETKARTGSDVFVREREISIVKRRVAGVAELHDEYEMFLHDVMNLSRRYQYGLLTAMQDKVIADVLAAAGLDEKKEHSQVTVRFVCDGADSDLNLFVDMAKLNKVPIEAMSLKTEDGVQNVVMTLSGSLESENMRRLICQMGKEARNFAITALN